MEIPSASAYFNIHLQNQTTREARLLMRYYMVRVFPPSLSADRKQIRSLVFEVYPVREFSGFFNSTFILKIQPADVPATFDASKSELAVHWLVTQLTALALRSSDSSVSITDPIRMMNAVLDTQCCNVVRLFDWGAEYFDAHFSFRNRPVGHSSEYKAAVDDLIRALQPDGLTIPDGFRTPGAPPTGKNPPRIMAAIMEHGGTTLTRKLIDQNALIDSYLLPLIAQEVQMLNALLVAHMSHLDSHADNRFVSDATDQMSALGFFYYHLSDSEVLRIPPTQSRMGLETLVLLKWADFGFSCLHTKDTHDTPWKVVPYDRFVSLRVPSSVPVLEKMAGLTLSPAYDMLRFATSVLLSVFSNLNGLSNSEIGQTLKKMSRSYSILMAMIEVSRPRLERMSEYLQIIGALGDIFKQFTSDTNYDMPYGPMFTVFFAYAKTNEWTFGTASTFEALPVWPLEFLRTHFGDYIVTPAALQDELNRHGTKVRCADMTMRHSPGRANRFFPERVSAALAPRAAYNHNARAIGLPEK